jgi:hypothetical protein
MLNRHSTQAAVPFQDLLHIGYYGSLSTFYLLHWHRGQQSNKQNINYILEEID